jgi:pimeloyl-ACP methyl ester carboxylesterase
MLPAIRTTRLTRRAALAGIASLAACGPTPLAPLTGSPRGRVVLLRGLLNMFSTGLNFLTADLRQANFDARVHNYVEWRALAAGIAQASRDGTLVRPFAIIGHSYGADDAIVMANHLGQQGIETDLLVTFDPTAGDPVGAGVARVLNFYQDRDSVDRTLKGGPGFTGTLENRLVPGESHISIDKQERLHAEVVALLQTLATERERLALRPVTSAPEAMPPPGPVTAGR